MRIAYLISVYLHILAAILWIGGMLFMIVALIPAIKNHPDKAKLIQSVGIKFRNSGWIALVILLLTGFFNLHMRGWGSDPDFWSNYWGKLGIYKIIIFIIIVGLSIYHDFFVGIKAVKVWMEGKEQKKSDDLRKQARWLGRINFLLGLIALFLGILMVRSC